MDDELSRFRHQRSLIDDDVGSARDGVPISDCGVPDDTAEIERTLMPGNLHSGHLHRRRRHRGIELVVAIQQRTEFEAPKDLPEVGTIRRLVDEVWTSLTPLGDKDFLLPDQVRESVRAEVAALCWRFPLPASR